MGVARALYAHFLDPIVQYKYVIDTPDVRYTVAQARRRGVFIFHLSLSIATCK